MGFKLSSLFKMRHFYYYVPPCPECGSKATGRFIPTHSDETNEYILRDCLKHGELVMDTEEVIPSANLFCMECRHIWGGSVQMRLLTAEEIMKEKRDRGTIELLQQIKMIDKENQAVSGKKNPWAEIFVFKPPML